MKEKKQEKIKEEKTTAEMETYHFYGDVVSAYQIGGKEVLLHPGQEVLLPQKDKTVKGLVDQGLLVRYVARNERIYTEPATEGVEA